MDPAPRIKKGVDSTCVVQFEIKNGNDDGVLGSDMHDTCRASLTQPPFLRWVGGLSYTIKPRERPLIWRLAASEQNGRWWKNKTAVGWANLENEAASH